MNLSKISVSILEKSKPTEDTDNKYTFRKSWLVFKIHHEILIQPF